MALKQPMTVAVIDYGMGNLHSVSKALEHVAPAASVRVTRDPALIRAADRVVLPGVGAIRDCLGEIRRLGFAEVVADVAASGTPLLGICVGLQALLEHSEENGGVDCLALLPGNVRYFGDQLRAADGTRLKVPHMGWNQVHYRPHPMWQNIAQDSRFYFVHSYYCEQSEQSEPALVAATCDYGLSFAAALQRDNVFAVQFHPEKSHTAGLQLLRNFIAWNPGEVVS